MTSILLIWLGIKANMPPAFYFLSGLAVTLNIANAAVNWRK